MEDRYDRYEQFWARLAHLPKNVAVTNARTLVVDVHAGISDRNGFVEKDRQVFLQIGNGHCVVKSGGKFKMK